MMKFRLTLRRRERFSISFANDRRATTYVCDRSATLRDKRLLILGLFLSFKSYELGRAPCVAFFEYEKAVCSCFSRLFVAAIYIASQMTYSLRCPIRKLAARLQESYQQSVNRY